MLAVLVSSGVAASATRKQSSPPDKWIATFCGSLLTWEKTVKASSTKLTKTTTPLAKGHKVNMPASKRSLTSYLSGLIRATDKLIAQLKAVGAPDVDHGSDIQKGVLGALGQIDTAFKQAKKAAQKLPTNDLKKFSKGALGVASTITASANRVGAAFTALEKYNPKDLNAAAKSEPACAKIG
jgi:hypothetical protein